MIVGVGTGSTVAYFIDALARHKAEFDAWRWEQLARVPDLVVPFRREVYRAVAQAFSGIARSGGY